MPLPSFFIAAWSERAGYGCNLATKALVSMSGCLCCHILRQFAFRLSVLVQHPRDRSRLIKAIILSIFTSTQFLRQQAFPVVRRILLVTRGGPGDLVDGIDHRRGMLWKLVGHKPTLCAELHARCRSWDFVVVVTKTILSLTFQLASAFSADRSRYLPRHLPQHVPHQSSTLLVTPSLTWPWNQNLSTQSTALSAYFASHLGGARGRSSSPATTSRDACHPSSRHTVEGSGPMRCDGLSWHALPIHMACRRSK